MNSIAVPITLVLTDQSWQNPLLEQGYPPQPTATQVELFTVFTWLGLALTPLIGVLWLAALVHSSRGQAVPVGVLGYPVSTDARWWPTNR